MKVLLLGSGAGDILGVEIARASIVVNYILLPEMRNELMWYYITLSDSDVDRLKHFYKRKYRYLL